MKAKYMFHNVMFLERLKKGREYAVAVACMMLPNAYKFGFGRDQEPLDA